MSSRIMRCGSDAAHPPHRNHTDTTGCPGIMPIWPCELPGEHYAHIVGVHYYCPGVLSPPNAMIGPQYPDSMVPPPPTTTGPR
jgi:hypothetical protein